MSRRKEALNEGMLRRLESEVNSLLKNKELTPSERIKVVEAGTRLVMIRHKVSDQERTDGAFFEND